MVPFVSLWLVGAQKTFCSEDGICQHGFLIKSPPLQLFNSQVYKHRLVIFQQSFNKYLHFLLSWVLMRDKLLSLRQKSWKRRFFILSKSSKGNYILKYLKGQSVKGSIAVDEYVTQMHRFFILNHVSTLLIGLWLYRHLFLIEVLHPNPTEDRKRVPWALVVSGCNLECMFFVRVKILDVFDGIWYFYMSNCGDVEPAKQTGWLHDPKGSITAVEDILCSLRTVLCIHSHKSKDGLQHS